MYFEEKIINGVMHYRNDPEAEFKPYTLKELSKKYVTVKRLSKSNNDRLKSTLSALSKISDIAARA